MCTVKPLEQSAKCVSGTIEVGPPDYAPPMSVSQTEISLADGKATGQIVLKSAQNWQEKKYGFQLSGATGYLKVKDNTLEALAAYGQGKYLECQDGAKTADGNACQTGKAKKLELAMGFTAVYNGKMGYTQASVAMTVQVGKRTGEATEIPIFVLQGVGQVYQGNPTLSLLGYAEAGEDAEVWQPYAQGLMCQATLTNAGLSAVRIGFEVGWSDIEATLPTEIPFNKCPLPSCKTKVCKNKNKGCWYNCEQVCTWTGAPSPLEAAKAGCKVAGMKWNPACIAIRAATGRRSLLFGPLPRNGSTPLDTQMDLDPTYNSFVGEVRVGPSTVFAGDMTGYAEDDGDELSLGTESFNFMDQGISLSVLGHKCEWKLADCDVTTKTSKIQIKVGGFLEIDVKKGEVWGKVDLKSEGSLAVIPFTRPIDLAFSGAVFERTASNKLNIMSALDDLSFCALVNAATTGGMGSLPIGWAGKEIKGDDIYKNVLGSYLVSEKSKTYLDMGKVLAGIIGQENVDALGKIAPSARDALKIDQSTLPDLTIPLIPAYSGTLGSAFSAVGGDQMCTT